MTSAQPPDTRPGLIVAQSATQSLLGYVVDVSDPDGTASAWLDIGAPHINRVGMFHGGLAATLLDVACGFAASRNFGGAVVDVPLVTVSLTVNYVGGAREGQRVIATGRVTGGGRKIAHVAGELTDDTDGLVATATGVYRKINT
ncbi:MAG: PaaI family thioesterase [Pseudomonadota bacterium]